MTSPPRYHNPNLQFNCYAIIAHPSEPKALLMSAKDGWSLPHFQPKEHDTAVVGHINNEIKRQLGVDTVVLRLVDIQVDREVNKQADVVWVLESLNASWKPPEDADWMAKEDLSSIQIALPQHKAIIESWLAEDEKGESPELRAPWAKRGWFASASEWMQEQLAILGLSTIGPMEQVRSWGITCMLRAPTESGFFFLKAVPPLFGHEPSITDKLAELFPDYVPTPLTIDDKQSWMLMADFGGKLLCNLEDRRQESDIIADWGRALAILGRMQIESVGHVEELLATGCQDRRLEGIPAQLDELLNDLTSMAYLKEDEVEKLRKAAPQITAMCARLTEYAVPQTLVHGDFHAGNISVKDGKFTLFDWTDACIAHPFCDWPPLFEYDFPKDMDEAYKQLVDSYLQPWTVYEPMERVHEAFEIGNLLGMLHQVISYGQIINALEPTARHDLAGGLTSWTRKLLASLSAPNNPPVA